MSKHKTKPIIIKINKLYLRLRDNFDNNNKITFFPYLSNIIKEIGIIKLINDNRILINYSNLNHVKYLIKREKGIKNIKKLAIQFNFSIDVVLKAIDYMDRYFLLSKNNYNNIIYISSLCLSISLKFNEASNFNKSHEFFLYLIKKIPNLINIEEIILQTLDFNLNTFSLIDFIHIIFIKYSKLFELVKDSPVFSRKIWFYAEVIVEDQRYLDFTFWELSLCLIHLSLLSYDFNIIDEKSKKKLKKYYNLLKGMKKIKFLQCNFILNIIISSRFNVNFGKIVN